MMQHDLIHGKPIDEVAIDRIREFEGRALQMHPAGYWLGHSGGKDSTVLWDLAKRAGVKFEAVHNLTTVDPPELVRFVRSLPGVRIERPRVSMWKLIAEQRMPPRRNARYCCKELKEAGGAGRVILTGVRWAESVNRSRRQLAEPCYRDRTKFYVNPIIDWATRDVWDYIRSRKLAYCKLYDEGWRRLGCVLCPMVSNRYEIQRMLDRWPKLAAAWKRAIDKLGHPQKTWDWWLWRRREAAPDPAEPTMFDDNGLAGPPLGEGEKG